MSRYLEMAAELIAAAAENNEKLHGAQGKYPSSAVFQENVLRLADAYAALAAIEHSQIPVALVQRVLAAIPADVNHSC